MKCYKCLITLATFPPLFGGVPYLFCGAPNRYAREDQPRLACCIINHKRRTIKWRFVVCSIQVPFALPAEWVCTHSREEPYLANSISDALVNQPSQYVADTTSTASAQIDRLQSTCLDALWASSISLLSLSRWQSIILLGPSSFL